VGQREDGAADGYVGGLRFPVVAFLRRVVADELPVFIHFATETGDFFFQGFDFGFSVHKTWSLRLWHWQSMRSRRNFKRVIRQPKQLLWHEAKQFPDDAHPISKGARPIWFLHRPK
jgi:hypothetical protein